MMFNTEATTQQNTIFHHHSFWLKTCMLVMFLLATLIRLDDIRAPGHLLDREYTSAIFARAFYFTNNEEIEDWRQDVAVTAKDQQPVLEPPLLDYLVSLIYRVVGREELYFARYLTDAFWLIGGIFMYLVTKKLMSTDEAVIATGYYLFVPMGIIISRSFQPDSLMMMMFLVSLYALVLYFEIPSTKGLLLAAVLTGMTLLLRPLVIFAIFFAFLAFSFHRTQNWKKLVDWPLIVFGTVSVLPSAIYYGYGIVFAGFMRWKVTTSFMPYLLTKKDFWLGWVDNVVNVAEFTPLLLAMLGFFLLRDRKVRYLVIGLSVSFILFSLAFTYHIHTHPYYHIQLFPIIGICLAAACVTIVKTLVQMAGKHWWMPVVGAMLLAFYFGFREVRNTLYQTRMENPTVAKEIGKLIHHSKRAVYVAYYYGIPLEYYGEFGGVPWPVRIEDEFYRKPGEQELSVRERITGLGFVPEYFIITNFDLYNRKHQDLKIYLENDCKAVAQTEHYLIYGSCQTVPTSDSFVAERIEPGMTENISP